MATSYGGVRDEELIERKRSQTLAKRRQQILSNLDNYADDEYGIQQLTTDMRRAGFSQNDITRIVSNKRRQRKARVITSPTPQPGGAPAITSTKDLRSELESLPIIDPDLYITDSGRFMNESRLEDRLSSYGFDEYDIFDIVQELRLLTTTDAAELPQVKPIVRPIIRPEPVIPPTPVIPPEPPPERDPTPDEIDPPQEIEMKTYTFFTTDDVVKNAIQRVTDGLWTGGTGSLAAFFTSSEQSGSTGEYYLDIYHEDPQLSSSAEVQFAVSYGHLAGSGSPSIENSVNYSSTVPTKGIYAQYKSVLLDPYDDYFIFAKTNAAGVASGFSSSDAYFVSVQRDRFKHKLDAGNWELTLIHSGSTITLIDDSLAPVNLKTGRGGRAFNIVSGTLSVGETGSIYLAATNEPSGGIGLFYPDVGVFAFNPTALSHSLGIVTSNDDDDYYLNHFTLFNAIKSGSSFQARSVEIVTSTHYYVRAKNQEYNFTNNPSFSEPEEGKIENIAQIGDPHTYVTTVGLYNANNEPVAVAKISRPIQKAFDREALIRVKIDF